MKSFTKKQQESYENAKIFDICNEKFENKYWKDKQGNIEELHIAYVI